MLANGYPNLFIIGAMKSGTTSLHNYLNKHPDIFMCEPKEPGYFVKELQWTNGPEWYLGLFRNAQGARIIGESSTQYTKRPMYEGVPERIRDMSPNARFIYIMRDPVERAISHYWHEVRELASGGERRSMLDAVRRDTQYTDYSDYAMQLEDYIRIFGRDAVYALTFEAMTTDPLTTIQRIFEWLGVDTSVVPRNLDERWNVMSTELRQVRGFGLLNRLRHSQFWSRIAPLMPRPLKDIGNRLAVKQIRKSDEENEAVISYLRPRLQEKTEALRKLLGRDFPEWKTLYG